MASHTFHEIYLHLNWHTKGSEPLITASIEPAVYDFLRDRCKESGGVIVHGIGGTPTHIHMAIQIEPKVCISDLIGDLKGACSHEINLQARMKRLEWQRGFGVVSFGRKNLVWVLDYIARQNEHHATGRAEPRLEIVSEDG